MTPPLVTLRDATTHKPVDILRLLRDEILVTHYTRPETYGSLYLPDAYSTDRTNTLWEVLIATSAAEEAMGMPLGEGDILASLRRWPRDTGLETLDGRRVFLLSISAAGVRGVISYTAASQET